MLWASQDQEDIMNILLGYTVDFLHTSQINWFLFGCRLLSYQKCSGVEQISKGFQCRLWNSKVDLLQIILLKAGLTLTQEWCSESVFKSQSFRTQNTVFLTRNVRDGYFPRAAHKSLLFCNVSERACLHVLRKEWSSMGQDSPPTPLRTALVICRGGGHWASVRRKGGMFLSEGSLSLKLSLVQPFAEWTFIRQVVLLL